MTSPAVDPYRAVPAPKQAGEPRPEFAWSWWVDGKRREADDLRTAFACARVGEGYVWAGLHHPTEATLVRLGSELTIHELVIEDAVHGHRRSKLERFDDNLFMVVSTVSYVDRAEHLTGAEIVSTGELMIMLGKQWVVTSRHHGKSRMPEVMAEGAEPLEDAPEGPWRVLHACLSVAIDDFTKVIGQMEEDVEEAEELVFDERRATAIDRPYQIKRELIEFRRTVAPLCAPLSALATREYAVIPEAARPYFRELSEAAQEIREAIAAMDDQLTNILQAALALTAVKDNRDMRKISAAVALLAVPTTIAAIYGQNFDNMPELRWEYGYFAMWLVTVALMIVMYWLFRKNKWL